MDKPCIECGQVSKRTRCPTCQQKKEGGRVRTHYRGDYAKRAKAVRDGAYQCWICGQGEHAGDPWQADHVEPGNPDSALLPAHRSCNIRRWHQSRDRAR